MVANTLRANHPQLGINLFSTSARSWPNQSTHFLYALQHAGHDPINPTVQTHTEIVTTMDESLSVPAFRA